MFDKEETTLEYGDPGQYTFDFSEDKNSTWASNTANEHIPPLSKDYRALSIATEDPITYNTLGSLNYSEAQTICCKV